MNIEKHETTHYVKKRQDDTDPNMYHLDMACKSYGYGWVGSTNKEKVDCPKCLDIIAKEK